MKMIDKETVHRFTFYESSVEVTEYPHDRPDEGYVEVSFDNPKSAFFWQDADGKAYLSISDEGVYFKLSGENLWELLAPQFKAYEKRRRELGYDKPKSKSK